MKPTGRLWMNARAGKAPQWHGAAPAPVSKSADRLWPAPAKRLTAADQWLTGRPAKRASSGAE